MNKESLEENIAIVDIKVELEGDNKMEKEEKRWSRKVVQKGGPETRNDILHPIANNDTSNH